VPEPVRLIIDADINKRVATELNGRGRMATATSELELHHETDEPLLRALSKELGDTATWVLVTGDDAMPDDHGEVLAELHVSLATIDPRRPGGVAEDSWRREVVHRWAHAMEAQAVGSIRRYSASRHGAWRPRRSGRRR
jgi:hypothetical protein